MARILFVLNHSTEAPARAATALRTALAAVNDGHEVALWLTGEGVRLGVQGVAETFREPGPLTAAEMVDGLAAGGAALYMERASFEEREFEPDVVRAGADIANAGRLAELIADGWSAVTL